MKVAKYKAATMREALAQAKRELGDSAIILSTRELRRGVIGAGIEITAVTEVDHAAGDGGPPPSSKASAPSLSLAESDIERIMGPLRSELRALRSLLRSSPSDGGILRHELADIKRSIAELGTAGSVAAAVLPPLDEVARGAPLSAPSRGRVVALVGPTGAGKTTTVAKLASRAALIRGHKVGLITLDDYRVGGEDQLRIYAELIPAPLHVASNRMELSRALHALHGCELIFIDTSGRSPRDKAAHTDLANTLSAVDGLEVHLVIPLPSAPTTIDSLAARYQSAMTIDRLLFTKLDETDDLSQLVRAPVRVGLQISHITVGQAVPEDLQDADDAALLQMAESNQTDCGAA